MTCKLQYKCYTAGILIVYRQVKIIKSICPYHQLDDSNGWFCHPCHVEMYAVQLICILWILTDRSNMYILKIFPERNYAEFVVALSIKYTTFLKVNEMLLYKNLSKYMDNQGSMSMKHKLLSCVQSCYCLRSGGLGIRYSF